MICSPHPCVSERVWWSWSGCAGRSCTGHWACGHVSAAPRRSWPKRWCWRGRAVTVAAATSLALKASLRLVTPGDTTGLPCNPQTGRICFSENQRGQSDGATEAWWKGWVVLLILSFSPSFCQSLLPSLPFACLCAEGEVMIRWSLWVHTAIKKESLPRGSFGFVVFHLTFFLS